MLSIFLAAITIKLQLLKQENVNQIAIALDHTKKITLKLADGNKINREKEKTWKKKILIPKLWPNTKRWSGNRVPGIGARDAVLNLSLQTN
jgi:cell division septal protein FtsQ